MSRKALFDFLSGLGQSAARVRPFIDGLDDAAAAKLLAAAEAGDNRAVLGAMAEQTWGTAPARAVPEAPAQRATRAPVSGMEWSARPDSYVQRTARDMADSLPPELAARIRAGDVEAAYEAIRRGPAKAGKKPRSTEDFIRELAKPADQVAAESIAGQFDRATGAMPPARQMELPLTDEPTAVVPFGTRGPGVPVGGPAAEAAGARSVEDIMDAAQEQSAAAAMFSPQAGLRTVDGEPAFNAWVRNNMGDEATADADAFRFDEPRQPKPPRSNRLAKGAAAAAGLGGAAYWASQNRPAVEQKSAASAPMDDESPAVESGGEADLAAETSPPPAVAATADTPEPTVVQAPQDYSLQARALINRLNDMRRAAGGEVPEAPAMMQEINRLMALGNQTRRATMVAAPQDDAGRMYQQAQALIDQVNQMYRQGMTPNSPQVQRLMAQVRQLQSQGDAIRNRRAG